MFAYVYYAFMGYCANYGFIHDIFIDVPLLLLMANKREY